MVGVDHEEIVKTEPFWEIGRSSLSSEEKSIEKLPCPVCGKLFNKWFDIKRHMSTHTGEKPFTCTVCGRGFSQKSTLQVHMNIHTGATPYSCDACGKKFRQKQGLNCHLKQQRCSQKMPTHPVMEKVDLTIGSGGQRRSFIH